MNRGDIRLGQTLDLKFTTRRFTTGVPFTLAGSPAVVAYVGNGTTEITAGITLSVDFDGRTGLNNVRVVASSGNGFSAGTDVDLVISAGTVDGVSVVGEVIASFSIENRSALMPTTSGRTLDVSAGGEAGVDWANVGSPTTTLNLSGTTVKTATDVETDTADIQSRLPAALVSGRIDASAGAIAANALTATAIAAGAITSAKFAAGAIDAAAIATDAIDADALAANAVAEIADGVWDEAISGHLTGGTTGAALNAAGSAGDPWSTPLPGAYGAGTAGKIVGDSLDATVSTRLAGAGYTAPDNSSITAIKAKTDQLNFGVTGKVDANITHVNEVEVIGTGVSGSEWGPA